MELTSSQLLRVQPLKQVQAMPDHRLRCHQTYHETLMRSVVDAELKDQGGFDPSRSIS